MIMQGSIKDLLTHITILPCVLDNYNNSFHYKGTENLFDKYISYLSWSDLMQERFVLLNDDSVCQNSWLLQAAHFCVFPQHMTNSSLSQVDQYVTSGKNTEMCGTCLGLRLRCTYAACFTAHLHVWPLTSQPGGTRGSGHRKGLLLLAHCHTPL